MTTRVQRACVWAGPIMMIIWMIGFSVFADFIPPPAPSASAEEILAMYRGDTNMIRFGLLLTIIACNLLAPYFTVITVQMKRIEGRFHPLAYMQFGLGMLLVLAFYFPLMILANAAYRVDRDPDTVLALNDVGWMMFVGVVLITVLQFACIAVAIFQDRRPDPVFPRWAGYFNLWVALMLTPGSLIIFFKTGPLAWNGFFTWWMPLTVFGIWLIVMTVLLLRAIDHQVQETAEAPGGGDEQLEMRRDLERLTAKVASLEAGTTSVS